MKQFKTFYLETIYEGENYVVRHLTYSSAVSEVLKWAEKKGYTVSEDDIWNQISTGKSKPKDGETNKFSLEISKDGKVQKKALQVQITGVGNKYELNTYIL